MKPRIVFGILISALLHSTGGGIISRAGHSDPSVLIKRSEIADRYHPNVHHRHHDRDHFYDGAQSQIPNQYRWRTSSKSTHRDELSEERSDEGSFSGKAAMYEVYEVYDSNEDDIEDPDVAHETMQQYSNRSQLIAFTLSCFFFGAARVYVEHYITGGIQIGLLTLLLLLICITCVLSFAPHDLAETLGINEIEALRSNPNDQYTPTGWLRQCMLISIFWVPLALIILIWWIHDIACFGLNDITDGNGVPLYPDLWG